MSRSIAIRDLLADDAAGEGNTDCMFAPFGRDEHCRRFGRVDNAIAGIAATVCLPLLVFWSAAEVIGATSIDSPWTCASR